MSVPLSELMRVLVSELLSVSLSELMWVGVGLGAYRAKRRMSELAMPLPA